VIDQLFERCFWDGRYRQVVGIAVEARKLEVLKRAILRASEDEENGKSSAKATSGDTIACDMLAGLFKKGDAKPLAIAYQIAFDLYDNSTQESLKKVREGLTKAPITVSADGKDKREDRRFRGRRVHV